MTTDEQHNEPTADSSALWAVGHAREIFSYQMLFTRETEKDAELWQAPALALTAQAFLLTIALNKESTAASVYLAAAIGILVACLAMQLMAKHRFLKGLDLAEMHRLENHLGMRNIGRRSYFFPSDNYNVPDEMTDKVFGAPKRQGYFLRLQSYRVWMVGLAVFAAANASIISIQIWSPSWLHG